MCRKKEELRIPNRVSKALSSTKIRCESKLKTKSVYSVCAPRLTGSCNKFRNYDTGECTCPTCYAPCFRNWSTECCTKCIRPEGKISGRSPILLMVLVHGYLYRIYSSWKLKEVCQYRIDLRRLLEGRKALDHNTIVYFCTGQCKDVVGNLFCPFGRKLERMGEADRKAVFLSRTKLESRSGRYPSVWRESVGKQIAMVKEPLKSWTESPTSAAVRTMLEMVSTDCVYLRQGKAQKSGSTGQGGNKCASKMVERVRRNDFHYGWMA